MLMAGRSRCRSLWPGDLSLFQKHSPEIFPACYREILDGSVQADRQAVPSSEEVLTLTTQPPPPAPPPIIQSCKVLHNAIRACGKTSNWRPRPCYECGQEGHYAWDHRTRASRQSPSGTTAQVLVAGDRQRLPTRGSLQSDYYLLCTSTIWRSPQSLIRIFEKVIWRSWESSILRLDRSCSAA